MRMYVALVCGNHVIGVDTWCKNGKSCIDLRIYLLVVPRGSWSKSYAGQHHKKVFRDGVFLPPDFVFLGSPSWYIYIIEHAETHFKKA